MVFAKEITPCKTGKIGGAVLDMVMEDGKIYIATDAGKVVIADEKNLSVVKEIGVRKIKDFMGELNDADIYSVDVIDGKILYLVQAEGGYAELFVYKDGNATKVLDKSQMLYAKAAKYADKDMAVIALMSDEVVLYDLNGKKVVKKVKAGEYFYSVMAIDKDRSKVAIGDEGGEVAIIATKDLKKIKLFKDVNKDKILSIDVNKEYAVAGSRADKTLALYNIKTSQTKRLRNPDFFIYVVALGPENRQVAFGDNDKYILKIADTNSLEVKYRLLGHKNIVNVIRFIDPTTLISGSETGELIKWRLK